MRSTLFVAAAAGASFLALSVTASAMPVAGLARAAQVSAASAIEKVEFKRRSDGSIYYVRPDFSGERPHYFAYRGYAYPYNPGYTYRLTRGELRPDDKLRRYRITQ